MPDVSALPLHVLLVSDGFDAVDVFGCALASLAAELEELGVVVTAARSP
jgi:hypothetical protein